jgi:hypothetical protein
MALAVPQAIRGMSDITLAHDQKFTHSYLVHYPDHAPREDDPYYSDFHAYKAHRRKSNTYICDFAIEHRGGIQDECDLIHPLECHHRIIEFSVMNGVDLSLLEKDYPGVSQMPVGKWVESAVNLMLLCRAHHRGHMGVHVASASDFVSTYYVHNLIS